MKGSASRAFSGKDEAVLEGGMTDGSSFLTSDVFCGEVTEPLLESCDAVLEMNDLEYLGLTCRDCFGGGVETTLEVEFDFNNGMRFLCSSIFTCMSLVTNSE